MNYYTGKVALVTGAAMGMGFATARAFAEAGAAAVLADVDEAAGQEATESLRAKGHDVLFVKTDVSKEADVKALVDATVAKYGRLDAAFNNAGVIDMPCEVPDIRPEDYERVMGINLHGVFHCLKYELDVMRRQKSGAVVNNSSIGGLIGNPGRSVYHATKHAVIGATKCSAIDMAAHGVRVNAVCPGTIDTPMVRALLEREGLTEEFFADKQPIPRLGRPEEIASAVVWLCSPGASYVTGHALPVDGGYTIL